MINATSILDISSQSPHDNSENKFKVKKRRVKRACDCCRKSKTKCDGLRACNKCLVENKICTYTSSPRPIAKSHYSADHTLLLEKRTALLEILVRKLLLEMYDDNHNKSAAIDFNELFSPNTPHLSKDVIRGKMNQVNGINMNYLLSRFVNEDEYEEIDSRITDQTNQSSYSPKELKLEHKERRESCVSDTETINSGIDISPIGEITPQQILNQKYENIPIISQSIPSLDNYTYSQLYPTNQDLYCSNYYSGSDTTDESIITNWSNNIDDFTPPIKEEFDDVWNGSVDIGNNSREIGKNGDVLKVAVWPEHLDYNPSCWLDIKGSVTRAM